MTRDAPPVTSAGAFVGREQELAELDRALARAAAGAGGVVLVTGEPGIGKSRLLEQAVGRSGHRSAWTRCPAGDGSPAYRPWTRVLRACTTEEDLHAAGSARHDVRVLVEGGSAAPQAWSGASRSRLLDGVARVLASAATRSRPLVVVLDDLQWADEASVRLLQVVVTESTDTPLLVLGAYRDTELPEGHPLADALHDLARHGPHLTLAGLSPPELRVFARAEIAERAADGVDDLLGSALHRQTGGNPFFARELVRLLAAEGRLAAGALATATAIPGGVRAVVGRRLARLPQPTHDLLVWAALAGSVLDVDLLAAATGRGASDVLAGLDPAVTARLVAHDPEGRLAFAHDLVRETLVSSTGMAQVAARRWRLGSVLAAGTGTDADRVAGAAGHLLAGVAAGDPEEAVRWAVRAAERSSAVLAHDDAARWYERATSTRRGVRAGDEEEGRLLLALGGARLEAGRLAEARDAFVAAAGLARARGDAQQLAAAALGLGSGPSGFEIPLFDQVQIDLLEESLQALPEADDPLRAWTLARLSVALAFVQDAESRRRLAEEAVGMARRVGDDGGCAYALAAWCDTVGGPEDVDRRSDAAGEVIRLAMAARRPPLELLGRRLRVVALMERGRLTDAAVEVEAFHRVAHRLRQPLYGWYVPLWRSALAAAAGDLRSAARLTDEADRLGASVASANARVLADVQRFVQLRLRGRPDELVEVVGRIMAAVPDIAAPESQAGSAVVADVVLGRWATARARADAIAAEGLRAPQADSEWLADLAQLADAAAALDHPAVAALVLEALRPHAELFVVEGIGAAVCGSVAHYVAQAARVAGHRQDAEQYGRVARRLHQRAGLAVTPPPPPPALGGPGNPRQGPVTGGLRREGDVWALTYEGVTVRVRDSKGLRDLAVLLQSPGRSVHVTELTGRPVGSTGEDLDATAVGAYRRRLLALEDELAAADGDGDVERAARLGGERDFLVDELRRALGLGGRRRRSGDPVERARKAVTARVRDSISRIDELHPPLGQHLTNSVRTGTWCCYAPERPTGWRS